MITLRGRRYLVTGGAGFLGSALVRGLLRAGARVRSFDNESRGSMDRLADLADDVERVIGDIRDADAVARAVRGVDGVCHLAYVNGTEYFYSKPALVLEVAVKGIVNVVDACLHHGVGELALASSSEVYQTPALVPTDETVALSVPDPLNPRYSYGGGKIIAELMAINHGRKDLGRVTIVRPHNVYGPRMGFEHVIPQFAVRMKRLAAGPPGLVRFPIQGTGRETRAFVYIDDMTAGFLRVIETGEHLGIYHVGTEDEITIEALAKEIGRCYGREVTVVPGAPAPGGTVRRCPDISKVRRLGYAPQVSLRAGLAKTVAWYDEHAGEATGRR